MTFLQLVQKLRQKVGGAGTGPTTVVAQSGELLDYVNWVQEAWLLIQALEEDWMWMRKDVSFQTAANKIAYLPSATAGETGVTDLAKWCDDDSWRCYKTATGRSDEAWLVSWPYQVFRDTYDFGTQSTIVGKPSVFASRDRDLALLLGQTPDSIYTVTGQYQATPTDMLVDADVPGMPARFHMLIVYRAMMLYGRYEAAPEVTADGEREFSNMLTALRGDQLEHIHLGPPLA